MKPQKRKLTAKLKSYLETRVGYKFECTFCSEPFNQDTEVIIKMANGKTKYYHIECWKNLFH
jgi:hypothetical protein